MVASSYPSRYGTIALGPGFSEILVAIWDVSCVAFNSVSALTCLFNVSYSLCSGLAKLEMLNVNCCNCITDADMKAIAGS